MFLYVNNSQIYPFTPNLPIIVSFVAPSVMPLPGEMALAPAEHVWFPPQAFLAPNFLAFVGRTPLSYAHFVLRSFLLYSFMLYCPIVAQSGDFYLHDISKISSHSFLWYQVHLLDSVALRYILFYSVHSTPLASFTSDQ